MCGTSHDGIDICDATFSRLDGEWTFEIHGVSSGSLEPSLADALARATETSALEYVKLDRAFAHFTAQKVNEFISSTQSEASFIASHGVTVFHQPELGVSTQIGSGAIIASLTGLKTISDFRLQDVSKGGQGAPLVPYADHKLFNSFDATLNLGGFANISILTDTPLGFDIGVCNLLLNRLSNSLGLDYDKGGALARTGRIIQPLYDKLNTLPYFELSSPKSLGKEWFDRSIEPIIASFGTLETQDLLRTATEHIAYQISRVLNNPAHTCLITGGGAHNDFLMERMNDLSKTKIVKPSHSIIDFKEALCFGFLGHLRLLELDNISSFVTGASKNSSAGAIYLP